MCQLRRKMTPRERVLRALNHQEPDRVPLDLGSTGNTGITAGAYAACLNDSGSTPRSSVWDRMQQLAVPDERVLQALHIDTRGIWLGGPDSRPNRDLEGDSYVDEWGVVRSRPEGGLYYDLVKSPLSGEITESDLARSTGRTAPTPAVFAASASARSMSTRRPVRGRLPRRGRLHRHAASTCAASRTGSPTSEPIPTCSAR